MQKRNLTSKNLKLLSRIVSGVGLAVSFTCLMVGLALFSIVGPVAAVATIASSIALGIGAITASVILEERSIKKASVEISNKRKAQRERVSVSKFEYQRNSENNIQFTSTDNTQANVQDNEITL